MTMGPGRSFPTVFARYHQAAATLQTLSSGVQTTINYDTNDLDSGGYAVAPGFVAGQSYGGAVAGVSGTFVTTGSSWVFTCPYAGLYRVYASLGIASVTWATTDSLILNLYKNGAGYSQLYATPAWAAIASGNVTALGMDIVQCLRGDTLAISALLTHAGGSTVLGNAQVNYCVIEKIE